MVGSVNTKATAGKHMPEDTFVGTTESIDISLDPSIAGGQDWMREKALNQLV